MKFAKRARRHAISELVATVLTMSLTLVAGFAVFGFVNGQANVTEQQYGQAVGQTVEYLEERFVITQFAFASGALTIYLYNSGKTTLQVVQVDIYNSTGAVLNLAYTAAGVADLAAPSCSVSTPGTVENPTIGSGGALSVFTQTVSTLTLTLPVSSMNANCPSKWTWTSGSTYYAQVTGLYGNQVVYYQVH